MKFHNITKLVLAVTLATFIQTNVFAIDDVWGQMGLGEDAVNYDNSQTNTVFDKYNKSQTTTSESTPKYPANLVSPEYESPVPISDSEHRTIKTVEFYGLNSVDKEELLKGRILQSTYISH